MKPFKVGDRVAVYGYFAPKGGGSVRLLDGDRGKVVKVDSVGGLEVRLDVPFSDPYLENPHLIDDVHQKQCRKLKPAEPRKRLYALVPSYGVQRVDAWYDRETARQRADIDTFMEVKEFIEVRKRSTK